MNRKYIFIVGILSIFISLICIGIGSINIDPIITYRILLNSMAKDYFDISWQKTLEVIILDIRFPRIVLAFTAGAAMSIIGVLMQTLTKNNLAEPYILGISSGASSGAVTIIILSSQYSFLRFFSVEQGAFIGSLIAVFLVFSINLDRYSSNKSNLILVGVGVSAFFMALTNFIIYSAKNNSQIITAMFWTTGSLSSATKDILLIPIVILFIVLLMGLFFSYELDILLLGDSLARTVGVNIYIVKIFIILASTILMSTIVSITGIIGFVGLIIPHMSRKIVGHKHKDLLPFSFFAGGLFLVLADTFARTIFSPEEVPIGVVTAFCGAPLFLWIIKKGNTMEEIND